AHGGLERRTMGPLRSRPGGRLCRPGRPGPRMTAPCRPARTHFGPDATSPAPGPERVRTRRQGARPTRLVTSVTEKVMSMPIAAGGDDPVPELRHPGGDRHIPVLADRVSALLAPALSGEHPVLVDATLGLGGHTAALMTQFPRLVI